MALKKLLVLGAGFLQSFVIKKARELGYYTIAIDKNPKAIGFKYANESEVIDIVDKDACLEFAISKRINGVITAATDYGVISTAYIAQQMGLPGLDYKVACKIKNKYEVRHTLYEEKVDNLSQYYEVTNSDVIEDFKEIITFPVIVKPCDGSGSKAIRRVDSFRELKKACMDAINNSLVGKALIEDFIEGKEFGVESFVYNGEIYNLGVIGKKMTNPPVYAELGHFFPSQLNHQTEEKIKSVVSNAIKSLGINFGAVNMDLLITPDDRICIVDIGARMGGNLIGSHIIPIGTGINYIEVLIRASLGDAVEIKSTNKGTNVVTKLLALSPGEVKKLPNIDEIKAQCAVKIYHQLNIGDVIREYKNNLDGCGYVVSESAEMITALRNAQQAIELIDSGIVRQ